MEAEIIAFDVRNAGRLADAWRSRYRPALNRVVSGGLPFQPLDVLHGTMLDEGWMGR